MKKNDTRLAISAVLLLGIGSLSLNSSSYIVKGLIAFLFILLILTSYKALKVNKKKE
ncbi:hypothetical protein [Latilactobacillus sakei]|uniref:hypothetical protein n=1 Tax=Latilactobacillus sakei TaxID=1599 RepID=UPI000DBB0B13|nr:hypothetical protein [Latilactobacillus sakei]BBE27165.1 hypothetical protein NFHkm12_19910 [Latilactobacillus curvatus]